MAILKSVIIKTSLFILPLLLSACYTECELDIDTKPVLCLNSLITVGEPIEVNVSRTWVYTDIEAKKDHSVKDAEIRIFANDMQADTDYIAKEGDRIRIEATSATYGSAEAEVFVPYAHTSPEISYDITVRDMYADVTPGWGVTGRILFDINATIDMTASEQKDKYYRLGDKAFDSTDPDSPEYGDQTFSKGLFIAADPIFSEYVSEFEEIMGYGTLSDCRFFSDSSFDGDSRQIRFQFEGCGFHISGWDPESEIRGCGYVVTLETISKSYFDWAMYYWNSSNGLLGEFSDMGLAEPIWGYSNVSTGAGVVAARSSVSLTIDVKDQLRKALDDYLLNH